MTKGITLICSLFAAGVCHGALLTDFSGSFALYQEATRQPPDFDDDGMVVGDDFLRWQRGVGLIGQINKSLGDANRDGRIDQIDLNLWTQQFGAAGIPDSVCFKLYFDPQGIIFGDVTAFVDAPDPGGGQQRFGIGLENGISEKHPDYVVSILDTVVIAQAGRQRIESRVRFAAANPAAPPIGELTIFGIQIQDKLPQLGPQGVLAGFDFRPGDTVTVLDDVTGQTTTFNDTQLLDVAPPVMLPLVLDVNRISGAVQIRNPNPNTLQFSYYEITSFAGALNPAGWVSIDDNEGGDPPGVGWDEAGGVSPNALAESNLLGNSTIAAGGLQPLGNAFNPAGALDVEFNYVSAGNLLVAGTVNYIPPTPANPVPEPNAICIALVGAGLVGGRRWAVGRSRPRPAWAAMATLPVQFSHCPIANVIVPGKR